MANQRRIIGRSSALHYKKNKNEFNTKNYEEPETLDRKLALNVNKDFKERSFVYENYVKKISPSFKSSVPLGTENTRQSNVMFIPSFRASNKLII